MAPAADVSTNPADHRRRAQATFVQAPVRAAA
jgi:hypothetical protein